MAAVSSDIQTSLEAIEKRLNSFMEGMPVLMNALDEVTRIHPFVAVAVMAFKASWALQQKRHEDDRKTLALHMQMKQMMSVLTQLKNVKDAETIAPDGLTVEGRMQGIVEGMADDITACANACDVYSKQKLVVKVLKGPIWEGRLVKFTGTFMKRRSEFEFALSIHNSLGVDAANKTLSTVDQMTQEMNAKMDTMLNLFKQLVTPEQKEMARLVEQRGGQACLNDDKALKELNDWENKLNGSQGTNTTPSSEAIKPSDLDDLKDDLHTDPDESMEQNMKNFDRKFAVQQRQIKEELARIIRHEGDRIIGTVNAGPHDRIVDPYIHIIWKEMGWRGSVKARHFVMALCEYFQEDYKQQAANGQPHDQAATVKADEWTLQYINFVRVLLILEELADDASGFVTVSEVNTFTRMRPSDWSLLRWITYWAIGHHQTMQLYVDRIRKFLGKMVAIMPSILPVNKSSVNMYLAMVYRRVYILAASLNYCYVNDTLQEKFTTYVEAEEARIRGNLDAVRYHIDASDTLELVTGQGRIERYIFPILYLLLERHFEILRVCQTRTVHPDELMDAASTLQWVFHALNLRLDLLQLTFTQQKLDLKQQFKSFAFGLYQFMKEPNWLWDAKLVQEAHFVDFPYDDSVEAQDIDVTKILNYPPDQEPLDFDAYTPSKAEIQQTSDDPKVLPTVAGMLGVWHGFLYEQSTDEWPSEGMCSMVLRPSETQGEVQYFTAADRANWTDFKIAGNGRTDVERGTVAISFKRSFPSRFAAQYFTGTWSAATDMLTGKFGYNQDPATHNGAFVFKRISPEYMCFAPAPVELQTHKPRALWAFTIAAVRFDIRRKRWAWSFFKTRRDNRRRFIELYIYSKSRPPLAYGEQELARVKKKLTTADSRFYHSLAEQQIRTTTDHDNWCDNWGRTPFSCRVCQAERDAKEAPSTPMTTAASNGSGVPSKILIYKTLILFLKDACRSVAETSRSRSEVARLHTTLDEYLLSMSSDSVVSGIVASLGHRKILLELSAQLNVANDPRLRAALRADDERIAEFIVSIFNSESAQDEVLLNLEGDAAQCFLDVVQDALNRGFLMAPDHSRQARRIIRKLSESCDSLPSSLFITGVTGREDHPTFAGGFGEIYRALYRNKTVALKHMRHFVQSSDLRDIRLKLFREALVWKDLRHPHILNFIGIDRESFASSFCMISPWMEHGTILNYLKNHGHTNLDKLLYEIVQGLQYLHSRNIVHGDLRGANILINDDWSACLADFGLSVFANATTTMYTSTRAGSIYWMAPELIDPDRFGCKFARSPASDVYAFGCVCLELYTGQPPFSELSQAAALLKIVNGERPARPSGSPAMSDVLWQHVNEYWEQNPLARPNSEVVVKDMASLLRYP